MVKYELVGVPDDLSPGEYRTRIKSSGFVDGKIVIVLEFAGDIDPDNPSLYTITKHDDGQLSK